MNFENKTAFVTGAAGGMGHQITCDLVTEGARVVMMDIQDKPTSMPGDDSHAIFYQGDLTNEQDVIDTIKVATERFGGIDLLANVAGALWFGRDKSALDIDLDVWDQVMAVNLKSMVHTTRHAVPLMKQRGGGAMVHFSSTQFMRGDSAPQDAYQAAKAGVIAYSKSLAIQLAPDNIRSNAIYPGPTESPMQDRWKENPAGRESVAAAIPLGRVGTVQDLSREALIYSRIER